VNRAGSSVFLATVDFWRDWGAALLRRLDAWSFPEIGRPEEGRAADRFGGRSAAHRTTWLQKADWMQR
jgi:hypothetical protein